MKQHEILEVIIQKIPYSFQMKDIDFSEEGAVRFSWRRATYRVSKSLDVDVCENGCLVGNDKAVLMRAILRGHNL